MNNLSGVYLHFPFCRKRCLYCDFFSTEIEDSKIKSCYGAALLSELNRRLIELEGTKIISIYFGGGTPALMGDDFFLLFGQKAGEMGLNLSEMETTIEINPADIDEKLIANLKNCGVNRVSIGIQAYDDDALKEMGRAVSVAEIKRNVPILARYFNNISFDLIYGIGKNRDINQELTSLFELSVPKHFSAYQYTKPRKPNSPEPLDEEESLLQESQICDFLRKNGFSRYEIGNYAQSGFESKHNLLYWSYASWLGIGAGASSFIAKSALHSSYPEDLNSFIGGVPPTFTHLTLQEQIEEFLLMGLRTSYGINFADFRELFKRPFYEAIPREILGNLVDEGFLKSDGSILKCSERGANYLNAVLIKLFNNIRL